MTRSGIVSSAIGGLLLAAAWGVGTAGQTTGPQNPPLVIASMWGHDLFEFYCGSCHGRDGKGKGLAASALKSPVPDLTTIAKRNGGAFPAERVESLVSGAGTLLTSAHGSKEMPVWGSIFRALDSRDARTKIRIANIVEYLETIQEKK